MNDELHQQSKELGFAVVDTFAMTTSRFNEFHGGRCSCHFHSVGLLNLAVVNIFLKTFFVSGEVELGEQYYRLEDIYCRGPNK